MTEIKKNDSVKLPGKRTGIVIEVDTKGRRAKCAIDPSDPEAGGGTAARWFEFDELKPNG